MNDFNKAQHERYVKALPNLIYTNALDFRFYKSGELVREISIGDYLMGIQPNPDQFEALENLLREFMRSARKPSPRRKAGRNDGGQGGADQRHHVQCSDADKDVRNRPCRASIKRSRNT